MLGWGEEGGVPYWLVANSWNTDWGENGEKAYGSSAGRRAYSAGYFRIIRGTNECGFEEAMVGGLPKL